MKRKLWRNWPGSLTINSRKNEQFRAGIFFRAVLLLLPVCSLPALDVFLQADIGNGHAVVSGRIDDISSTDLARELDSGGTLRLIWMFRLEGVEETLVRCVHRDLLGPGYIVYSPGRGDRMVIVPPGTGRLVKALSSLDRYELTALGSWEDGSELEYRVFLDTERNIPPLSIWSLFRRKQIRSPWTALTYPRVEIQ